MTQDLRRSPLSHRRSISAGEAVIALAERPFMGMLILRGEFDKVEPAVKSATGVALPKIAGTFAQSDDNSVMWLGPDEWLIVTRDGTEGEVEGALKSALSSVHSQVVNVTDFYTAITISGSAARDVLAKTTMIDLHARVFTTGHAVASTFGHAGGWLQLIAEDADSGPKFVLYVRRSMADYLWCLLADAGREFGLAAQEPIGQVKLHLPHFETAG